MENENEIEKPIELNLEQVFKDRQYIIPLYQRNYAWKDDEIEQLLNDINDSEKNYYIGNLILNKKSENLYEVIDGQQRLTTLYLLLSYLKETSLKTYSLQFEAREKSNKTLDILRKGSDILRKQIDEQFLSNELSSGYDVIENYFEEKNEAFKDHFKARLPYIKLISTQVPSDIDLNQYFEIMNTRGEQLEIHEIAKERILNAITCDNDKEIAAIIWDCCYTMNSYVQMNFEKTLREIIFGKTWNSFVFKNFSELRKCFDLSTDSKKDNFSLFDFLENEAEEYKKEDKQKDENIDKDTSRFNSIVSFQNFLLIVNEALKYTNKENGNFKDNDVNLDDKKFLENLEDNWKDNDSALSFIYNLLRYRFLFDKFIVKRKYNNNNDNETWLLQNMKRKDKNAIYYATEGDSSIHTNLCNLEATLRITYTSPKTMHWISILLSSLDQNTSYDLGKMLKLLETYACKKIKEANFEKVLGFQTERIIFTYLDYVLVRDKSNELDDIKDYHIIFRNSIEHFYPQHPSEEKPWEPEDLNNFGNLALITVKGNSKFSNLNPIAKINYSQKTIDQSPKLKLMSKLTTSNNNQWNEKTAKEHGNEMHELLKNELKRLGL